MAAMLFTKMSPHAPDTFKQWQPLLSEAPKGV
jgi:hypothetical protein